MRNIVLKSFLIIFLFSASMFAAKQYEEGKVYRHKLENGLSILTMERHIAPLIYHQLSYNVGSRNEQLGITGLSHIVEHMMFKGTKKYSKGKVSKTISENSGIFNAFTMSDMTAYYEYMPADKIEIAFDIESDRMVNSIFNPDEFDSEIEVIKQERRMRSESNVNGIIRETVNSVAFKSHPNRDPVIGWPTDIDKVTRDEAYEYYKTYYTPNNSLLVLVGDFETEKIIELAKKYYGVIPRGPELKDLEVFEEPQHVKKTFTVGHADVSQPSMQMYFHIPTYNHEDAAVLKMAGMILCEKSRDARLYKRMVNKDKLVASVAGGFGLSKDPGLFRISLRCKAKSDLDKIEETVWEELDKMKTEPVSDHELQKVKNRFQFSQVTGATKNGDIGTRLSRYEIYFGYELIDKFQERVAAVTKDDIIRVMNKYFNENQVTIGYALPQKKKNKNTQAASSFKSSDKLNLTDENKFFFKNDTDQIDQLFVDGSIARPKAIAPDIKTMKLKNGITLHTIENHLVPSIQVIGSFETGVIEESIDEDYRGISGYLADVLNRASTKQNYEQLSERMAFVPFSFSVSGSYRGFQFQGTSLIKDADEMFRTGFEMVTEPALNEADIEVLRPKKIRNAKNRFKRTSMKAFNYMYNTILGEHPLTQYYSTKESIKNITKTELKELHQKYFNPNRLTLLIIGDMTPEEMKKLADKYYGSWNCNVEAPELIEMPDVDDFDKKEIKIFTEPQYTECTVNIGFAPFNKINSDEDEIVKALNYILASSALTSRMGIELRDKQGLIYGLKSELWKRKDGIGYWKFNTKTSPANTEKVITGIFSEIKKLLKEGITDEELKAAKDRQLGLLPFYVETPDDVAQLAYNMMSKKQSFDYFDKKTDRINSITKDDILRIAEKYFTLDKFMVVVDGPIKEDHLAGVLEKL